MSHKEVDNRTKARPFVKWAGGKGALIKYLVGHLPDDFTEQKSVTYIEPFVGGGAMLFYMLTHYQNIEHAIINDVNEDLMGCYRIIKERPQVLIELLSEISARFYGLGSPDERTALYYQMRECYNHGDLLEEERTACFMFLNRTCFNGLYRVNADGKFNVPSGKYQHPKICDKDLIMADHELLEKVDIQIGNYDKIGRELGSGYNFFYMDPPYRPLSGTSNFIEYTREVFNDAEQEKLKKYCDMLTSKGCKVMQSNSNSKNDDGTSYFANLYADYQIDYIEAHRFINAHVGKREKETELIIMNYRNTVK